MNELDLIRRQLRSERSRVTEVARACAAPDASPQLRQAAWDYLVFVLTRFEERDRMLAQQYRGRLAASDPARGEVEEILSRSGTSRQALATLEAVLGSGKDRATSAQLWVGFAQFVDGPWGSRRDAIDALLARNTRVADWRAVSFVDADSFVEERARYARLPRAP